MADKKISEFPVFSGTQDNQTYYIIASGESNDPDADNYKMPFTDLAEDISSRMLLVSGLSGVFEHITSGASGVFTNIISGATGSFTEELLLDGKPIVTENAEGGVDLGSTEKPPEGVDAPPVNLLHAGEEKISMDDDIIKIGGSSNDPNDKVEIINSTVIKETLTVADGKETILGGSTTVKETLTVADGKETVLGGNTTVKETLTVADGKQTILGGATTIKGTTSLSESLTVADGKQTILGGATTIKGAATFNSTASFKSAADVTIGGTSLESILAAASSEANDLSSSVTWANVPDANITKSSVVQHLKWGDISGVPSTFPPSSHRHSWSQIDNAPSSFPPSSHRHSWSQIDNAPSSFPPSSHNHTLSDITDLTLISENAGNNKLFIGGTNSGVTSLKTYVNGGMEFVSANICISTSTTDSTSINPGIRLHRARNASPKQEVDIQITDKGAFAVTMPQNTVGNTNLFTVKNDGTLAIKNPISKTAGSSFSNLSNGDVYHDNGFLRVKGLSESQGLGGNVSQLSDLSDVTISSLAKDDILYYDGSKWVNDAPSEPAFISDEKYKTQISPISSPLSKVNSIKGADFTWSNEAPSDLRGKKDVGVIAQDIQKVLPEAVELRENGDLIVKYHRIIPLLIESIKELDKENKDLKRRLAKIEEL